MNRIIYLGCVCVILSLLVSCGDKDESILSIEREVRIVNLSLGSQGDRYGWEELEDGLYRMRILIPPTFLMTYSSSGKGADPFADPIPVSPKTASRTKKKTAQEVLEEAGITFGPGASASYNRMSNILTVVQTSDQMDLVNAYTDSIRFTPERQMHVRAEIYRLPSFAGIEVLESIRSHGEHSPERDAVFAAAREGKATLVAAPAILTRSGQRGKTEQVISSPVREVPPGEEDKENTDKPVPEDIPILSFEVDPVLGADEYTVDLNLLLELRDRNDPDYSRSITTQVTKHDNDWILIGNWNEVESGEMVLVFVTTTIQTVGDSGRLVEDVTE